MKRSGPLPRRTRLKNKGGSRFKHRRDPAFMRWMLDQLKSDKPCDCGCGYGAHQRSHLIAKGSGGDDVGNVVLLNWWCHTQQEKRTDAFNAERGCDLYAAAQRWADQYERERSG